MERKKLDARNGTRFIDKAWEIRQEKTVIEKRKNVTNFEDLRPAQEERFNRQMDMAFKAHPYYIELFKKMGLTRGDIKCLDDLKKLPLTYKEDWIARQMTSD